MKNGIGIICYVKLINDEKYINENNMNKSKHNDTHFQTTHLLFLHVNTESRQKEFCL